MKLKAYIYENYETLNDFCAVHNFGRKTVSNWIRSGCIVKDGKVYSPRADLLATVKTEIK